MTKAIGVIDENGKRMYLQYLDYITGECVFTNLSQDAAKYIDDAELLQMDCALIIRDLGLKPVVFDVKYII